MSEVLIFDTGQLRSHFIHCFEHLDILHVSSSISCRDLATFWSRQVYGRLICKEFAKPRFKSIPRKIISGVLKVSRRAVVTNDVKCCCPLVAGQNTKLEFIEACLCTFSTARTVQYFSPTHQGMVSNQKRGDQGGGVWQFEFNSQRRAAPPYISPRCLGRPRSSTRRYTWTGKQKCRLRKMQRLRIKINSLQT